MQHGGSTPTTTLAEPWLVSVNVAPPRPVGRLRSGTSIVSGIGKRPVTADTVFLDVLNPEGDGRLEPGRVSVAGPISVLERHPAGVTVLRAHRASQPGANRAQLEAVAAVEPLAEAWRGWLLKQLGRS